MTSANRRRRRSYYIPWGCLIPVFVLFVLLVAVIAVPILATRTYGSPAETLTVPQRFQYALALLWYDGQVTRPLDADAGDQTFTVSEGEQAADVAANLEQEGLVRSADAFRA